MDPGPESADAYSDAARDGSEGELAIPPGAHVGDDGGAELRRVTAPAPAERLLPRDASARALPALHEVAHPATQAIRIEDDRRQRAPRIVSLKL